MILSLVLALFTQVPSPVITYPSGVYEFSINMPIPFTGPLIIAPLPNGFSVTWGNGPAPVPPVPVPVPPVPQPPAPVPAPVPVLSGHLWAVAVVDPAVPLTAAQIAMMTSATLATGSLSRDVHFIPDGSVDPAIKSWLPEMPAMKPALAFIGLVSTPGPNNTQVVNGKLLYVAPFPTSEAEYLTLIRKVTGK